MCSCLQFLQLIQNKIQMKNICKIEILRRRVFLALLFLHVEGLHLTQNGSAKDIQIIIIPFLSFSSAFILTICIKSQTHTQKRHIHTYKHKQTQKQTPFTAKILFCLKTNKESSNFVDNPNSLKHLFQNEVKQSDIITSFA